jgi:hypothetical protein
MSLTFDEFDKALEEWDKMDERLTKLFGFNPATCNHYGAIQIYNERINSRTTDEEIMEIRSKYLNWKKEILAFLEENNFLPDADQLNLLFSVDGMFGTLYFLDEPVDIHKGIDPYRENILLFLKSRKLLKSCKISDFK